MHILFDRHKKNSGRVSGDTFHLVCENKIVNKLSQRPCFFLPPIFISAIRPHCAAALRSLRRDSRPRFRARRTSARVAWPHCTRSATSRFQVQWPVGTDGQSKQQARSVTRGNQKKQKSSEIFLKFHCASCRVSEHTKPNIFVQCQAIIFTTFSRTNVESAVFTHSISDA